MTTKTGTTSTRFPATPTPAGCCTGFRTAFEKPSSTPPPRDNRSPAASEGWGRGSDLAVSAGELNAGAGVHPDRNLRKESSTAVVVHSRAPLRCVGLLVW